MTEKYIDVFGLLLLFLESAVIADHSEGNEENYAEHRKYASDIIERGNEESQDEGRAGSDEPATDNSNNAGNAVNCGFASPSAVGKRGTHRDHEGYIRCGERKLERSTDRNEQTGQHEVDTGTNKVESHSFFLVCIVFVEAAVDPILNTHRNVASYLTIKVENVANRGACDLRRGEYFLTLVLTREIDGALYDLLGFFRGPNSGGHDHTSADKEEMHPGQGRGLGENPHIVLFGRNSIGVVGKIKEAFQTSKGDTDKIHEVIAGKCHGQ